jgi:dCTP deaminase
MILEDGALKAALASGQLVITPLPTENIGPSSIDLRLGDTIKYTIPETREDGEDAFSTDYRIWHPRSEVFCHCVDPDVVESYPKWWEQRITREDPYILMPGEFVLGSTREWLAVGPGICGNVEGKSSWGRLGLAVHATAGFIDAGFSGEVTLEIFNVAPYAIMLRPGRNICQLKVQLQTAPSQVPYDKRKSSRYQDQRGVTESRVHLG